MVYRDAQRHSNDLSINGHKQSCQGKVPKLHDENVPVIKAQQRKILCYGLWLAALRLLFDYVTNLKDPLIISPHLIIHRVVLLKKIFLYLL